MKYRAHPWHGVHPGVECPKELKCFIEVVPGDEMKYEIEKESGFLIVDRPNLFSSTMPMLYGFIPQTYSDSISAQYCMEKSGLSNIVGDGDPVDICVLTDRNVPM